MAGQPQSGRLSEAEFDDLLQALSATTKGRLFLGEYMRRFRPQETRVLLEALQRIEAAMNVLRDQLEPERLAGELRRIATTIEIAASDTADGAGEVEQRRTLLARIRSDLLMIADDLASAEAPDESRRVRAFVPDHDEDAEAYSVLGDDLELVEPR